MKKDKKVITGTDIGIVCNIIGIIASIFLIKGNLIDNESITISLILLFVCGANLSINLKDKKDNQ